MMYGDKIQIKTPSSTICTAPPTLRVTDPFERLFFFLLNQCKTWFVSFLCLFFIFFYIFFFESKMLWNVSISSIANVACQHHPKTTLSPMVQILSYRPNQRTTNMPVLRSTNASSIQKLTNPIHDQCLHSYDYSINECIFIWKTIKSWKPRYSLWPSRLRNHP